MNVTKDGVEPQGVWGGTRRVINAKTPQELLAWVRVRHNGET
jgi:hypothetical protein